MQECKCILHHLSKAQNLEGTTGERTSRHDRHYIARNAWSCTPTRKLTEILTFAMVMVIAMKEFWKRRVVNQARCLRGLGRGTACAPYWSGDTPVRVGRTSALAKDCREVYSFTGVEKGYLPYPLIWAEFFWTMASAAKFKIILNLTVDPKVGHGQPTIYWDP